MTSWKRRIRSLSRNSSARRLHHLKQSHRLPDAALHQEPEEIQDLTTPPAPPIILTPQVACSPDTDMDVLWHIALHLPELRKWIVANPQADAAILEFISQAGGPGVKPALEVLLESLETEAPR
nr:hypothetical protein [Bifidobacterium felsineum]